MAMKNRIDDVKTDIEKKIIMGDYGSGEQLPTLLEMAELYGIGNSTAHKVLKQLSKEDTIYSRKGIGFFVRPFVKEKLAAAHAKELKSRMETVVKYGKCLGYDTYELINLLTEIEKDLE